MCRNLFVTYRNLFVTYRNLSNPLLMFVFSGLTVRAPFILQQPANRTRSGVAAVGPSDNPKRVRAVADVSLVPKAGQSVWAKVSGGTRTGPSLRSPMVDWRGLRGQKLRRI